MNVVASDLVVGDEIVLQRNRLGQPSKTLRVKSVERGESCNGMHVNVVRVDNRVVAQEGCWDRIVLVDVVRQD